jgi:hypothetical protein
MVAADTRQVGKVKLFGDYERTDPTPMRDPSSSTGHICPECRYELTAEWEGEHREGCGIGRLMARGEDE